MEIEGYKRVWAWGSYITIAFMYHDEPDWREVDDRGFGEQIIFYLDPELENGRWNDLPMVDEIPEDASANKDEVVDLMHGIDEVEASFERANAHLDREGDGPMNLAEAAAKSDL